MTLLSSLNPSEVASFCREHDVDGWLLYDFKGVNPIARRVIGGDGMATRRLFVWLPKEGTPVALAHKIELQALRDFPGDVRPYAAWQELHATLGDLVRNRRVAMETSREDAVPYLDRIPHGVIELIGKLGGTVVSSAPFVSTFAARWSPAELEEHRASAETIADIARQTIRDVVTRAGSAREAAVQRGVLEAMERAGLVTDHPPIVAFGPNAANPHYVPQEGADAQLEPGQAVLLDLWGGPRADSVFADQTWMGCAGEPSDELQRVWTVTRDARDAVVDYLRNAMADGNSVTGAALDDVARGMITEAGYGEAFVHRTGHSIDVDLHGSGPHLDNFETNDVRELLPGVGFSVEPGIYLPGNLGVRSEINVVLHVDAPEVTPTEPQRDLILPD